MPPEFIDDPASGLRQFPKEMRPFLRQLSDDGWRFRDGGHKWWAVCWCDDPQHQMTIAGTPREPTHAGRRLVRRAKAWHPEP